MMNSRKWADEEDDLEPAPQSMPTKDVVQQASYSRDESRQNNRPKEMEGRREGPRHRLNMQHGFLRDIVRNQNIRKKDEEQDRQVEAAKGLIDAPTPNSYSSRSSRPNSSASTTTQASVSDDSSSSAPQQQPRRTPARVREGFSTYQPPRGAYSSKNNTPPSNNNNNAGKPSRQPQSDSKRRDPTAPSSSSSRGDGRSPPAASGSQVSDNTAAKDSNGGGQRPNARGFDFSRLGTKETDNNSAASGPPSKDNDQTNNGRGRGRGGRYENRGRGRGRGGNNNNNDTSNNSNPQSSRPPQRRKDSGRGRGKVDPELYSILTGDTGNLQFSSAAKNQQQRQPPPPPPLDEEVEPTANGSSLNTNAPVFTASAATVAPKMTADKPAASNPSVANAPHNSNKDKTSKAAPLLPPPLETPEDTKSTDAVSLKPQTGHETKPLPSSSTAAATHGDAASNQTTSPFTQTSPPHPQLPEKQQQDEDNEGYELVSKPSGLESIPSSTIYASVADGDTDLEDIATPSVAESIPDSDGISTGEKDKDTGGGGDGGVIAGYTRVAVHKSASGESDVVDDQNCTIS